MYDRLKWKNMAGVTNSAGELTATDRTTVWYLIPALYVGGAERRLVNMANGLDSGRYDVTVWTFFDQNPLVDELAADVTHRSLGAQAVTTNERDPAVERPADPVDYLRAPLRFTRQVRAGQPDVVHSFLFYDNMVARFAGLSAPKTTIVTEALGFQHGAGRHFAVVDRLTLRLSDVVVSNSRGGLRHFRERGVDTDRLAVVRDGRDVSRFEAATGPSRADLGIRADAPVVGTVGRMVERKGHADLLDAWPRVLERHSDAVLVLVGDGEDRPALEAQAERLGCSDSVLFTGIRDSSELLPLMDLFAFPSHWEGLPGALIEAMIAGLPIVATAVPGNDELVTDGETGVLVPVRDPMALAAAIGDLLADPDRAERLAAAARREGHDEFSLDAMVETVEALYDERT
jgi:glycosyltransferase involved in cell wall biosynthesis